MTPAHFTPVPLDKSYRLMNHGPTVLVSEQHGGSTNVMAAAWACVPDYGHTPKVTVVLDKATFTRKLIEASGAFALQLPTRVMATLTVGVGTLKTRPMSCARSTRWRAGSSWRRVRRFRAEGAAAVAGRPSPAFKAATGRAFDTTLAAACDPENGPEYALAGWSLAHGLSSLMIDDALDGLPMPVDKRDGLVRMLTGRMLGARLG